MATQLAPAWLGHAACRASPTILCGDFNATPLSGAYRQLAGNWRNVWTQARSRAGPTFPSRLRWLRLDHIFASADFVEAVQALRDPVSRIALDHLLRRGCEFSPSTQWQASRAANRQFGFRGCVLAAGAVAQ